MVLHHFQRACAFAYILNQPLNKIKKQAILFTADIFTCNSRKRPGAANNVNNDTILFNCPSKTPCIN